MWFRCDPNLSVLLTTRWQTLASVLTVLQNRWQNWNFPHSTPFSWQCPFNVVDAKGGRAPTPHCNSCGMDSSVKLTRHIVTLIVALSITWQSVVPCGCAMCSHGFVNATLHNTNSEVSLEGCSHSSHHHASTRHSLGGSRIHRTHYLSTFDPDSRHSICHRFFGTATSKTENADVVLKSCVSTRNGIGPREGLRDVQRANLLSSRRITHLKIDPGAVLRLQV